MGRPQRHKLLAAAFQCRQGCRGQLPMCSCVHVCECRHMHKAYMSEHGGLFWVCPDPPEPTSHGQPRPSVSWASIFVCPLLGSA